MPEDEILIISNHDDSTDFGEGSGGPADVGADSTNFYLGSDVGSEAEMVVVETERYVGNDHSDRSAATQDTYGDPLVPAPDSHVAGEAAGHVGTAQSDSRDRRSRRAP